MSRRLIPPIFRGEARQPAGVTVFGFHGVVQDDLLVPDGCWTPLARFRAQLESILARFEVVALARAMTEPPPQGRRRAVLTFDDGFQSHHDLVLPLLQQHKVAASFFINTGVIDTPHGLWFSRLHDAICETRVERLVWDGAAFPLQDSASRAACSGALQRWLKLLPAPLLEEAVDTIRELLGRDPRPSFAAGSPFRALDTAALRAMRASGLCDFGGHTHSHAILSRLDPAAQREEIADSVRGVRDLGLGPADAFAYPNGGPGEFGSEAEAILRELGVRWAFGTHRGACEPGHPPFRLPRRVLMADHPPPGAGR